MTEDDLRAEIVWWGRSLFARGLTSGTSGSITVRCGDGFLATPTKEIARHRPFYAARAGISAVVHLHSTPATGLSCRADVNPLSALRPVTPYVVKRLGVVPVLP